MVYSQSFHHQFYSLFITTQRNLYPLAATPHLFLILLVSSPGQSVKGYVATVHKLFSKLSNRKMNRLKRKGKVFEQVFHQSRCAITDTHVNRYTTPFVIREMHI